jgi:protein TonB
MRMFGAVLLTIVVAGAQSDTVYKPGDGVSLPKVTRQVGPQYTSEAMSHRIEGVVVLDVVVKADGAVGDVKVTQSLDTVYGLDDASVKAMKQWAFKPGMKDGKPVAVRVEVSMTFALSGSARQR